MSTTTPQAAQGSSSFGEHIRTFVDRVGSLHRMIPILLVGLHEVQKSVEADIQQFINVDAIEKELNSSGRVTRYKIPPHKMRRHRNLQRMRNDTNETLSNAGPTYVVAMVSQYDAFLGRLIVELFKTKPELLNASNRQFTFEQLSQFTSIDEARTHIASKEAESVLRSSHSDQFEWLEKRLGMSLRKDLPAWSDFVEITERRNLFVHADGVVADQYLKNCRLHGHSLPAEIQIGTKLAADQAYFDKAYRILIEIGVKLGQVLWRKFVPNELTQADETLNDISLSLINHREYRLAERLFEFGCHQKKVSSQVYQLFFKINLAQCHKWQDKSSECRRVLKGTDWSALGNKFQLAGAILEDRQVDALNLVRKIGTSGEVEKVHYYDWPIFRKLRQTEEFAKVFKEVFSEPFVESRDAAKDQSNGSSSDLSEAPKMDGSNGPSSPLAQ